MGNKRNQTNKLITFFAWLAILSTLFVTGCTKKALEKNNDILDSWIKQTKQQTEFAPDAKVVISAPLTVSFPDIDAYRGAITTKDKQWDGIFFINKKDKSVQFMDVYGQKVEGVK